jgi:hypothetical protein
MPPDRVREFSFKASGGSYAKLFDGSEKLLSWDCALSALLVADRRMLPVRRRCQGHRSRSPRHHSHNDLLRASNRSEGSSSTYRDYQSLLTIRPGIFQYAGGGSWTQSTKGVRPDANGWLLDGQLNADPGNGRSVVGRESKSGRGPW